MFGSWDKVGESTTAGWTSDVTTGSGSGALRRCVRIDVALDGN